MESTTNTTAVEGFWRAEPLPAEDRPVIYRKGTTADSIFGQRLVDGMAANLEAEFGSLPPSAFTWMEG